MHNDLFTIGPLTVHGYGLMIGIGILAAYYLAEYRAKRRGLDPDLIFSLTGWIVIPGFLGAKLLYLLTAADRLVRDPSLILAEFSAGFVVYGGIIFGFLGGMFCCRLHHIGRKAFFRYLDAVIPSIALAQGFGRIGCLLAGCCYGIPYGGFGHITFPNSHFAPNHIALFPTQPVSSLLNFLHFAILLAADRVNRVPGRLGALYLICYSVGRFGIEFFRGDLIRGEVGVLSTSQFISVFVLLAGVVLWAVLPRINGEEGASL